MRRTCAAMLMVLALSAPSEIARAASEPDSSAKRPKMMAVVPPTVTLSGRVLLKDGVTPVTRAEVAFTGAVDEHTRSARCDLKGRFEVRLPAGGHSLRITKGMEIYRGRSVYRVPPGGPVEIDFLLLPDFEPQHDQPSGRAPIARGPDPVPESPVETGSVVDMVRGRDSGRSGRWGEALGFLGSLLAVALSVI